MVRFAERLAAVAEERISRFQRGLAVRRGKLSGRKRPLFPRPIGIESLRKGAEAASLGFRAQLVGEPGLRHPTDTPFLRAGIVDLRNRLSAQRGPCKEVRGFLEILYK